MARGAVAGLAERARRQRERFAILTFGGDRINWLLPPGRPPRSIAARLATVPAGGTTPLARAMVYAGQRLEKLARREPGLGLCSYIFTDGRTRDDIETTRWPGELTVIDTEHARVRLGRAGALAARLGGRHITLSDFLAERT